VLHEVYAVLSELAVLAVVDWVNSKRQASAGCEIRQTGPPTQIGRRLDTSVSVEQI